MQNRMKRVMIVIGAAALAATILLTVFIQRRKPNAWQIGHVYQLRILLMAHAEEGVYPSDFSGFEKEYPSLFVCPGSDKGPGDMTNVDSWTNWVLVPERKMTDPPETILAYCSCQNHGFVFVITQGKGVQWYPSRKDVLAALAETPAKEDQ